MLIILLEPFLDGGRSCDILKRDDDEKKIKIIDSFKEMLLLLIRRENVPHQMNVYDTKNTFPIATESGKQIFLLSSFFPKLDPYIMCVCIKAVYCYVLHMPAFLSLSLL